MLGRLALESGRPDLAITHLKKAKGEQRPSFEAGALLAGALTRLGRMEEAAATLASLADESGEPARTYLALAGPAEPGPAWEAKLAQFTGYYPDLLDQSSSLAYGVGGPLCISDGQEVPLKGAGYDGVYLRSSGRSEGYLKLWLQEPWPEGALKARLKLTMRGHAPTGEELAQVEIWSHGWGGGRLLARRAVRGGELAAGTATLSLPFKHPRPGGRLEVRLNFVSPGDLRLEELSLGVDLPGHMRSILRWYHEARGRVALQAGRHAQAVASFLSLLDLDPTVTDILLPLAQALMEAGRLDEAFLRVRQAESAFPSQPGPLSRVRELYQLLQRPQDAARVERMLLDLHPSLKREARLANGLTLLGYDLSRSEVKRGGELNVTYYWQVWSTPPLDYYIFVHLKGADRILPFDHLLDHGRQPMTELSPGQVVRESYRITVPADAQPGRYRLLTGMWDPRFTGQRVAVAQGEGEGGDEVTLATVEVR
jgi:tetratricopeptide (TPR) repeat protein